MGVIKKLFPSGKVANGAVAGRVSGRRAVAPGGRGVQATSAGRPWLGGFLAIGTEAVLFIIHSHSPANAVLTHLGRLATVGALALLTFTAASSADRYTDCPNQHFAL